MSQLVVSNAYWCHEHFSVSPEVCVDLRENSAHLYPNVKGDTCRGDWNRRMLWVGDMVEVRGCFGMDEPTLLEVVALEETKQPRMKDGTDCSSVAWDVVRANRCVVTLANSTWAYGEQVRPV